MERGGTRVERISVWFVVLISILPLTIGLCHADSKKRPPPDVQLTIPSMTMTDEHFLRDEAGDGTPVALTGDLRLPNWDEKLPVVILLHGSDGPKSLSVVLWRNFLDKLGVATFRLDAFTGRNISSTETDQSTFGLMNAIYDVYRTVEVLAEDPRIDGDRIFVMGFSRGGQTALYAALTRFHKYYGPKSGKIAGYIPFYGACSYGIVGETELVDAPIRAFHGEADDWVPVQPCREFIERARAAGHDATLTSFPGVRHAFDNPNAPPGQIIAGAPTPRNCRRKEVDGVIINVDTGKPFSFDDACIEFGPTVGYDKAATDAAAAKIGAFLAETLR